MTLSSEAENTRLVDVLADNTSLAATTLLASFPSTGQQRSICIHSEIVTPRTFRPMIRIGDKKVVYETTLLLPDNIPGELDFTLDTWNVKIRITCDPQKQDDKHPVSWAQLGDTLHIDFRGMDNSLGTASKAPIKIGTASNGENLGFLFFHHRVGTMNRLDFSFLLGGTYA